MISDFFKNDEVLGSVIAVGLIFGQVITTV